MFPTVAQTKDKRFWIRLIQLCFLFQQISIEKELPPSLKFQRNIHHFVFLLVRNTCAILSFKP